MCGRQGHFTKESSYPRDRKTSFNNALKAGPIWNKNAAYFMSWDAKRLESSVDKENWDSTSKSKSPSKDRKDSDNLMPQHQPKSTVIPTPIRHPLVPPPAISINTSLYQNLKHNLPSNQPTSSSSVPSSLITPTYHIPTHKLSPKLKSPMYYLSQSRQTLSPPSNQYLTYDLHKNDYQFLVSLSPLDPHIYEPQSFISLSSKGLEGNPGPSLNGDYKQEEYGVSGVRGRSIQIEEGHEVVNNLEEATSTGLFPMNLKTTKAKEHYLVSFPSDDELEIESPTAIEKSPEVSKEVSLALVPTFKEMKLKRQKEFEDVKLGKKAKILVKEEETLKTHYVCKVRRQKGLQKKTI